MQLEVVKRQAKLFDLFDKAIKNNKLSHAYLFDSNNNSNSLDVVLSLCKMIMCENDDYFCDNCSVCNRISHDNYTDVKIIRPDGNYIKKEQIIELQNNYSMISIEGKKRIYIILDCDKMNTSTSNSLLKFLEEPYDDVIAFLVTNNVNKVIDTIKSRCQVLKLVNEEYGNLNSVGKIANLVVKTREEFDSFINDENNINLINDVIEFIEYYENNGLDVLIYADKMLNLKKRSRDDVNFIFDMLINFYYDIILLRNGQDIKIFNDYMDILNVVDKLNSDDKLLKKLSILLEYKEYIKFNVNIGLLFDSLIISFEGDKDEYCRY